MESEEYYNYCRNRGRNEGLFTADQKLKGNNQISTRQNPNGNRSGLECPEERDYFPWPFPSPFIDLKWVGNDVEYCKTNIAPFSQRVRSKGTCTGGGTNIPPNNNQIGTRTKQECEDAQGTWLFTQPKEEDNEEWANSFCAEAAFSQVNSLGNADGTSKGGQMDSIDWWVPEVATLTDTFGCHKYTAQVNGK